MKSDDSNPAIGLSEVLLVLATFALLAVTIVPALRFFGSAESILPAAYIAVATALVGMSGRAWQLKDTSPFVVIAGAMNAVAILIVGLDVLTSPTLGPSVLPILVFLVLFACWLVGAGTALILLGRCCWRLSFGQEWLRLAFVVLTIVHCWLALCITSHAMPRA